MKAAGLVVVALLALLQAVACAPVNSYGLGSNVIVNFYSADSFDEADCFISSCADDVSIVQSVDPNYGTCGSGGASS